MDVTLPNGRVIQGVPEGATQAEVKRVALANGLASDHDFTVAEHTAKYADDIGATEQQMGLPSGLLSSLISKESGGNPNAVSSKGAFGLGQTLPTTLADMGYDEQETAASPKLQIQAAGQYLSQMLKATNGNVQDALTAYHSGLGNLAKYQSGEKQMGPETAGYASDPRFSRFIQQAAPQQAPQNSSIDAQQQANSDIFAQMDAQPQSMPQPTPDAPLGDQLADAGRGLAQAGVNVANIPGSIVNTGLQAVGVPQEDQVMTIQLPESMRPRSDAAKLGAEIGPYLIPIPGAQVESVTQAAARGAQPLIEKVASIIGRNLPQSAAENVVGALAQNASSGNQDGFAEDLATGTAASLGVRGVIGAGSAAARRVLGRGADEAAPAVPPVADDTVPPAPEGSPQPSPAPASSQADNLAATSEEEALRNTANQTPAGQAPLASSLEGLNIAPRADVREAADRLGLTDDLLPSHLSGNEQYQAVEQAIKSRPGSALKVQEDEAINKLAQGAGRLIDDVAQAESPLALSQRVNDEYATRMAALERRSDQLYKRVDEALPGNTPVQAPATAAHVERMADDVGGWNNLSTPEKAVFKAVNPEAEKMADGTLSPGVLTYARLNRVRKDIGNAIGKRQGVYKDEDVGILRGLYSRLSEDQKTILGDVGARRDFEVANRLVQMRKGLEEQMVALRGKDLTKDAPKMATDAIAAMAKGNNGSFRKLFDGNNVEGKGRTAPLISTRTHRQQLLANAIGEQLSAGKRGKDFNAAGFADWYGNLRQNGGLNLIAKHLPASFMAQLKDTYTVADAIRRAKGKEITTGRLNDFTRRFDRVNKSAELLGTAAERAGAALGSVVGNAAGAAGGAALGKVLSQRIAARGGAASADAAEALIASPAFQAEVRKLQRVDPAKVDDAIRETNARVRKMPAYQKLIRSLPKAEATKLARLGLLAWLNSDDTEN